MPLARIEIEQHEGHRWHAEVEAGGLPGGPNFRRVEVNAQSYEEIQAAVTEAYRSLIPPPPQQPEIFAESAETHARHAAIMADVAGEPTRAALLAKAEVLGIEVDRRWGETRLREAIAARGFSAGTGPANHD